MLHCVCKLPRVNYAGCCRHHRSDARHMASNACDFQAQVFLKQFFCSSPLKQASYKQLTVIFSIGQAFSPQAARPDMPASRFAEILQTEAGKQQMAAGAGFVTCDGLV